MRELVEFVQPDRIFLLRSDLVGDLVERVEILEAGRIGQFAVINFAFRGRRLRRVLRSTTTATSSATAAAVLVLIPFAAEMLVAMTPAKLAAATAVLELAATFFTAAVAAAALVMPTALL